MVFNCILMNPNTAVAARNKTLKNECTKKYSFELMFFDPLTHSLLSTSRTDLNSIAAIEVSTTIFCPKFY